MVFPLAWIIGGTVIGTVAYLCSDNSSDSSNSGSSHSEHDVEKKRRQAAYQQAQQANEAEFNAWQRRHGLHGLSADRLHESSDPILAEALAQLEQTSHHQQRLQEAAELEERLALISALQQALDVSRGN
ncbi:hypothetical protein ABT56_22115 [Photobacterium aquae]|uniref:Uncharacterized protein n=1 Tax=Photobacterium aquae TaxID=1195763 RepID=A0A0J1GNY0_9GAMM|nr:hypothetical protein [Photobacterium aquae]KLV01455.1 hypothetical protein ABT56_22115 [Photobacterium aquae]